MRKQGPSRVAATLDSPSHVAREGELGPLCAKRGGSRGVFRRAALALGFSLSALACQANIDDAAATGNGGGSGDDPSGAGKSSSGGKASNGSGAAATGGLGTGAASGAGGGGDGAAASDGVPVVTRLARLTHLQYDRSVRDLLAVSASPAAAFVPDAQGDHHFDNGIDLAVDGRLAPQYREAAEELAEQVAKDSTFLARFVGCAEASPGCSDQLIAELGRRAFRRPLSPAEGPRFAALFARGAELVGSGNAFRDGTRLIVEAMLQSPQFIYRVELSAKAGSDGLVALDPWEMATRLSFLIWNSTPSKELLAKAEAGSLGDDAEITASAAALLDDARARESVVGFHSQAFHFDKFKKIAPDASAYPKAPAAMAKAVESAAEAFVSDVVFDAGGGIVELLNAPYAFADPSLAPIYGKTLSGTGLQKVNFPGGERRGLLMQAGFLAANAYSVRPDPIHRGLFIQRDLLCANIPDPPPGASMTPLPALSDSIKTNRQQVAAITMVDGCSNCHERINGGGFAFEAFDAIGQTRTTDNGEKVDTSGAIAIDGRVITFDGAGPLVQALSTSTEVRRCYVGKWLEYAYGRNQSSLDRATLEALAEAPASTRSLLQKIVTSKSFRFRAPNPVGM